MMFNATTVLHLGVTVALVCALVVVYSLVGELRRANQELRAAMEQVDAAVQSLTSEVFPKPRDPPWIRVPPLPPPPREPLPAARLLRDYVFNPKTKGRT
jgi:uncharacterized membrane protein